ncbi:FSD1-like protein isoform X1 [Myripristis murdjan]|uniref:FSD1-like protein isoform X1 n=1 Tax=Myripristis murdjan TaxID=586833 RepID=UPI001175F988|nr:FSD1-like protein isoform X1 [Myripristis murdjan]
MDAQKEALHRIVSTLANKNAELRSFLETVDVTLSGLQDESWQVTSQLEAELERLRAALEEKGAELRGAIREEQHRKEAELQRQRLEAEAALEHSAEVLRFANEALSIANEDDFVKAARQIKDRVTMAPAFRLTTRPAANQSMACFMTDFSQEEAGLRRLHFLPVPRPPEVDASSCLVRDNVVTVAWRPVADGDGDGERIERYDLEFRKTNDDSGERSDACWERISNIRANEFTITGLKFDSPFISVRVRAANKAAAGDFCQPVTMETRAFSFGLDAASSHPELQVDGDTVSWQPLGVKGHDGRLRAKESGSSRSATPSPNKTAASRAARERFAGDSYTVLGDQEMSGGCHYWELRPLADWKSFSVGVAYRSALGRFDQLGKSAGSWCLSAGQWLQSSLAAKHNNRSKALDWPLPQRIGVCCDFDNGSLLFVDVDRPRLLHSFRARFTQPLVPAFTVWGGGITVATGLQVPSFMGNFLPTNRSLTNLSQ